MAQLRVRYAHYITDNAILPAQTFKLCKITNIIISIVRRNAKISDTTQSLLSYARAFEEVFCKRLLDERLWNSVKDMMFSKLLSANCRAMYVQYIIVDKMMVKIQSVLQLPGKRNIKTSVPNTFTISRLNKPSFNISSEKPLLL